MAVQQPATALLLSSEQGQQSMDYTAVRPREELLEGRHGESGVGIGTLDLRNQYLHEDEQFVSGLLAQNLGEGRTDIERDIKKLTV